MTERAANGEAVVDELNQVWTSVLEAGNGLTDPEWELPTDCPGWTVRDQVSHLIGIERMLLGDPAPPALVELPAHVKHPFGEINEAWIEARRGVPGQEVLSEFADTTYRRLMALRSMRPEEFDVVGWSPAGDVPYREFMETRVLDTWAHEQDIRKAVGRPGGRNRAGERITLDRCARAMPYVVGKKVAPPEGTSVLFVVTGILGRRLPVVVAGGRASVTDEEPSAPTVTLTMDQEPFARIGLGRVSGTGLLDAGVVTLDGDADLGRTVLAAMPFMI
jgi:uncharacterized protein (TIGR03083 family)